MNKMYYKYRYGTAGDGNDREGIKTEGVSLPTPSPR